MKSLLPLSFSLLALWSCADAPENAPITLSTDGDAPSMDTMRKEMSDEMATQNTQVALAQDAPEYKVQKRWGGNLVTLSGEPAVELAAAMKDSGYFNTQYTQDGFATWGYYTVCIADSAETRCRLWVRKGFAARTLSEDESADFGFIFQGKRFSSAATEVFVAIVGSQGISPTASSATLGRFSCQKTTGSILCGITRPAPAPAMLELTFTDLPPLGEGYVYEGWLITADGPVTSGRFSETDIVTFDIDATLAAASTMFVLTIEPEVGDDPAPSDTHILAGVFEDGVAILDIAHPAALGTDFADAAGEYILETPSSADPTDWANGIWFVNPATGPSLSLPTLPPGWVYEGWVVGENGPVSTGRFVDATMPDSDGAGPAAGPLGTPPVPGQDFVDPAMSLLDGAVVISVEPEPDDSAAPFILKPLIDGTVDNVGPGVVQSLDNLSDENVPSGVALLQ